MFVVTNEILKTIRIFLLTIVVASKGSTTERFALQFSKEFRWSTLRGQRRMQIF